MQKTIQIYFDESGTTGSNLTDKNHPFLVIASNSFSADLAAQLKEKHFPHARQGELKHTNLRTRRSANVVRFITEVVELHSDKVKFFALHKAFALIIKVYQYWIEDTLSREARTDGYHSLLVNHIFHELRSATNDEKFYEILESCKAMFQESNYSRCLDFWEQVTNLSNSNSRFRYLKIFAESSKGTGEQHYNSIFADDDFDLKRLSVHFTSVLALISYWQNDHEDKYLELFHDGGSEMQKYCQTHTWKSLIDPKNVGFFQGPQLRTEYPLRVSKADFTLSSKDCIQIQLCDVIAGAAAEVSKTIFFGPKNNNYVNDLLNAGIFKLGADVVLPNLEEAMEVHKRLRKERLTL